MFKAAISIRPLIIESLKQAPKNFQFLEVDISKARKVETSNLEVMLQSLINDNQVVFGKDSKYYLVREGDKPPKTRYKSVEIGGLQEHHYHLGCILK